MKSNTATIYFGIVLYLASISAHGADTLLLQNNESLSGTVLNDTLQVSAPYATVQLDCSTATRVELMGVAAGTCIVRTLNGTRITGHLEDPVILFQSKGDAVKKIPRENVLGITFGGRKAAPHQEGARLFFVMKNGDYFNGPVSDKSLTVAAPAETSAGSLHKMRSISLTPKLNQKKWITIGKGNEIQGLLVRDDIAVALEASPNIKFYENPGASRNTKGRVSGITLEDGPLQLIRMRDSTMIGYCVNNLAEGVHVRNVTSGRPAYLAGMQVGDWVISIDGRAIVNGSEVWALRDEIIAGKRQHLLLETRRGEETHWYLLIK